nr:antimicrobial peptide P3 [uncultured bacterium]
MNHFKNIGRVNYLGQPMLQRVSHCFGYPRPVIGSKSKPA